MSEGRQFDASYWMRNLREPVRFSETIRLLAENGHNVFLEIGPHTVLLSAIRQVLIHSSKNGQALPSMLREEEDRAVMLRSLGMLYVIGYPINWDKFYSVRRRCAALPAYPWQRQRCWFGEGKESLTSDWVSENWKRQHGADSHPLLGRHFSSPFPANVYYWEVELNRTRLDFLNDYRFQGVMVVPSSTYLEMARAAAAQAFGAAPRLLSEIEFQKPLFLPAEGSRIVQIVLSSVGEKEFAFRIYSRPGNAVDSRHEQWLLHATGKIPLESAAI
jgi:acyl transferase domain-containing protein